MVVLLLLLLLVLLLLLLLILLLLLFEVVRLNCMTVILLWLDLISDSLVLLIL